MKSQQSVFSRLVSVIITSWSGISLDEIRTKRILREKADCKQSIRLTIMITITITIATMIMIMIMMMKHY